MLAAWSNNVTAEQRTLKGGLWVVWSIMSGLEHVSESCKAIWWIQLGFIVAMDMDGHAILFIMPHSKSISM